MPAECLQEAHNRYRSRMATLQIRDLPDPLQQLAQLRAPADDRGGVPHP